MTEVSDKMYPNRDPYRRLHNHRRRSPRRFATVIIATLLVGCAAAAAMMNDQPSSHAAADADAVVATLTAHDAVANALFVAEPRQYWIAHLPKMPETIARDTWTPGRPVTVAGSLRKNESISASLIRRKVPQPSIFAAIDVLKESVNFRRSKPDDPWEVDIDGAGRVTRLRYAAGPADIWEARRVGDAYRAHQIEVPTETRLEVVSGTIGASLWQAFEDSGAGGALAVSFADTFAYTIDFVTETQQGDRFFVAFESTWLHGERLTTGEIVAARYVGATGDHYALLWDHAYYDELGESVERQFLRSPLASVRITSRFGRRFHPVLGKMKMHAGVDYGAPIGTPVQAVADGRVTWASTKGANGKLVAIRHAGGYTTYYAHLSKISKGLRPGVRVKKKQILGKVGSTGRSTGPHLHFGMKRYGKYTNPLKVDFDKGAPLGSKARTKFLAETATLKARLQ